MFLLFFFFYTPVKYNPHIVTLWPRAYIYAVYVLASRARGGGENKGQKEFITDCVSVQYVRAAVVWRKTFLSVVIVVVFWTLDLSLMNLLSAAFIVEKFH